MLCWGLLWGYHWPYGLLLSSVLGHVGFVLGHLGVSWATLSGLESIRAILKSPLGLSLAILACLEVCLGLFWDCLGLCWDCLHAPAAKIGCKLSRRGRLSFTT